jgi:septal ring factor EnvC (AmiA/AmiB activator)
MKEIKEDGVLFAKTDEDLVMVETTSASLSQATAHNDRLLNEKLSQVESDNNKLKDEIISLKEEMHKRRKVECDMTPLRSSILEQQDKVHDVKMKCFTAMQKMADKMKMVEKHLEIVSKTNQRMASLQAKIENLEQWRYREKNVPCKLLVIKSYDISVHTLATTKCQDLASRFEENTKHNLARMMDLYEKSRCDI